jgi:hypothetical protein
MNIYQSIGVTLLFIGGVTFINYHSTRPQDSKIRHALQAVRDATLFVGTIVLAVVVVQTMLRWLA